MPSARDLLQQADALMRSNRNVGRAEGDDNVPVLTDVAVPSKAAESGVVAGTRDERIPVLTNIVPDFDLSVPRDSSRARFPGSRMEASLLPLSEMPSLPPLPPAEPPPPPPADQGAAAVGMRRYESRIETGSAQTLQPPVTEMPKWLEPDLLTASPPAPAPAAATPEPGAPTTVPESVPPAAESAPMPGAAGPDEVRSANEPRPAPPAAEPEPLPPAAVREPSPQAVAPIDATSPMGRPPAADLAETIYYQVLQNLDLYTEGKLQEHLTRHLTPIMEQASRELLATLNANLGAVLRQYVAEAIEKQLGVRPAGDPPP